MHLRIDWQRESREINSEKRIIFKQSRNTSLNIYLQTKKALSGRQNSSETSALVSKASLGDDSRSFQEILFKACPATGLFSGSDG